MRLLAFFIALVSLQALAQGQVQQIQSTSPQLAVFAGSDANLQSLVNGLSLGQAVTVVTQDANGVLQIATFTPPSALGSGTPAALEQARTALIARGITQPSAQQIAVALMGGSIVTGGGTVPITGVLTGSATGNGIQVRNDLPAGTGASAGLVFGGSTANLQALANGLLQGAPITLTNTVNGVLQSVTFTAPGGPMSAVEVNQALLLASQMLAGQGIVNPTPAQIQAALLGGTVAGPNGSVLLQGVLQNRTVAANTPPIGGSGIPTVSSPSVQAARSGANTGTPVVGPGTGASGTAAQGATSAAARAR